MSSTAKIHTSLGKTSPSSKTKDLRERISSQVRHKPNGPTIYGSLSVPWDNAKKYINGLTRATSRITPGKKGGSKRRRTKKRKTYKKK